MEEETKSSGTVEKIILDDITKGKWYKVVFSLKKQFGKKPNMDAIIFLIGVNEFGQMREFAKDEKMDLMHIATCKLLSYEGYFAYDGKDEEGWPHYTMLKKPPYADLMSQENLLRKLVVKYYEENNLFEEN